MKIDIKVPDGKEGDYEISTFIVSKEDADRYNFRQAISGSFRPILPGTYKRLKCNGHVVMSNTPAEIRDHSYFIREAKGKVLINGLGLGMVVAAIMDKEEVADITVVEISPEVIKLSGPTYSNHPKVTVVNADAYEYQPSKGAWYDYVWHDIWNDITVGNVEGMKRLHRKYGRRCGWQGSWCRDECEYRRDEEVKFKKKLAMFR